jgi:uncharacterized iron-regulated membrane protein
MSVLSRTKRLTYLIHRWTGVAGCVLMALWFVSGMVMLYVGYPKLTPAERLAALPPLPASACCVPPAATAGSAVLTSIGARPRYVLQDGGPRLRVVDAVSGRPAPKVDAAAALDSARAFMPGTEARYAGQIVEDRWTHSRGLDSHRPLHAVTMLGDAPATLYVSSATGQVVLDAPLAQQRWNYVGAWLHWLYLFRDRSVDPVWSWTVIVLSAAGTVTALTGALVGIWRWRFGRSYKSGSRSPYRAPWMRWHHIAGLLFAAFVCTWIFSGLMSMNPVGIFDARSGKPDLAAYRHGDAATAAPDVSATLQTLNASGFHAVEIAWRQLDGHGYLLAYDRAGRTRLVTGNGSALRVRPAWDEGDVLPAASRLLPAAVASHQRIERYDAYYYGRHAEAMNGAAVRGLPALLVQFDDPGRTRVYIDLRSGDIVLSLDRAQRAGRWLFSFLHSWDAPWFLAAGVWRDVALIVLSLGGFALSLTGIVIGLARLRQWARSTLS